MSRTPSDALFQTLLLRMSEDDCFVYYVSAPGRTREYFKMVRNFAARNGGRYRTVSEGSKFYVIRVR